MNKEIPKELSPEELELSLREEKNKNEQDSLEQPLPEELQLGEEEAKKESKADVSDKESLDSRINNLTNEEKTLFLIEQDSRTLLQEMNSLSAQGKIDKGTHNYLMQKIENLRGAGTEVYKDKLGEDKTEEIIGLVGEQFDKNFEESVARAKNFDDLTAVINRTKEIYGTKDTFTPEELLYAIDKVRKGEAKIEAVTRTGGLRQKVADLLESEKDKLPELEKKISNVGSVSELYKVLNSVEGIQGSDQFYSSKELVERIEAVRDVSKKTGAVTGFLLITESAGLRDKITELIEKEIKQ